MTVAVAINCCRCAGVVDYLADVTAEADVAVMTADTVFAHVMAAAVYAASAVVIAVMDVGVTVS